MLVVVASQTTAEAGGMKNKKHEFNKPPPKTRVKYSNGFRRNTVRPKQSKITAKAHRTGSILRHYNKLYTINR